jgi:hypothetical protein
MKTWGLYWIGTHDRDTSVAPEEAQSARRSNRRLCSS